VTYVVAVLLGVSAGVLAGLFGVGGGVLFVPTLTWLGLTQLHAEATSLLAIIPTVLVGVWRQQSYGNVRWRPARVGRRDSWGRAGRGILARARAAQAVRCAADRRRGPAGVAGSSKAAIIPRMPDLDELWIPLVDEPIGSIVQQILDENPDVATLVGSPHRILAFRTFAYIRCGLTLGQLLFDSDLPAYDGSESWVDALLKSPEHHAALTREVRAVAEEIAADPRYAADEPLGPDDAARERFRAFARDRLG